MKTKRLLLRGLLGLGILLTCSPVIGLLITSFVMKRVFHNPTASIDEAPLLTGIGIILAPFGILLMIASLIALRFLNRSLPAPLPPPFPPTQG